MINLVKAALRGVKAELSLGTGWTPLSGGAAALSTYGRRSDAGPVVSAETIMTLSTVWACTTATAQLVASLPCGLYERDGNGGKRRVGGELEEIVIRRPNGDQTGVEFWESQILQMLTTGNGISRRLRVGSRLVGLEPLPGATVRRKEGRLVYENRVGGSAETLDPSEVFHLRGFGAANGIGLSAVRYGTQSFGAALAADRTASRVFANSLQPSGVLQTEQGLKPEQREAVRAMLDTYTGSERAGKAMVLESGLSWNAVQWTPEDAQLLETRRYQVEDVCRWFGIPPVVIGHASSGQTMWGSGVEMVMLSWLQTGINPILRRIEARLLNDLVPPGQRGRLFFEFNREAMLQMDSKAKADFLSKMATSGTMTANERRAKLNLPPHADPAAEELLAQTALAPLRDLGDKDET